VFSVVRAAAFATQRREHISAATNAGKAIEELCFLFVRAEKL
jgi:hypothetical protein